jgi:hypothetical protein
MTNLTPIYKLPSPELLVGAADGPAAIQALAQRTELVMPTLRAQHENVVESAYYAGTGTRSSAMDWSVAGVVNGWVDVNFRVDFAFPGGDDGAFRCCGGHAELWINSVQVRNNIRFHNECAKYGQFSCTGSGSLAILAAATTVRMEVWIAVDTSSAAVGVRRVVAGARQYGGLASS